MSAIDTHADTHADPHPPFLAHHWNSPRQQFEAGKLGMWLFLATEFLLFGGLFCAYAVFRFNQPELFEYGSQFLNRFWGATNTVVLILSSLTMAAAVTAAQLGRTRMLVTLLSLTFLGGAIFMCIKYVEYKDKFEHNIVWGTTFYEEPAHAAGVGHAAPPAVAPIIAAGADEGTTSEPTPASAGDEFVISRSTVAPAAAGPAGLATGTPPSASEAEAPHTEPDPRHDPNRPVNAHIFFGIYFAMTGLHGLHVLAGMGVIAWLIWRSAKGQFSAQYFTPVDLGGLYWHVVDLIWIFLFPLLYLIA